MKRLLFLAASAAFFAACSQGGNPSAAGPVAPEPRGYNEYSSGSGWVRADKDDYAPGETVSILGGGWEPGEMVVMNLSEDPDVQEDLVLTSVADADGNFVNAEFSVTEIHIGVAFTLSARGESSGMTASTMFNDGTIQDASIEMREITCLTPQGTVTAGTAICAHASFTISGSGATHAQFRWKDPSGTVVAISQRSPSFPTGTSGAQTHSASFTPTVDGTWTVLFCESNNSDMTLSGCPGPSQRASQTFTVDPAPPSDSEAPIIDCTPLPNQAIWYGDNVTVNCTASDAGSGLADPADAAFSLSTSVAAGVETASAETDSREVCDNDGNCATAGPYTFKVDRKAPEISCGAADGAWHGDDVSIGCTASDGGSDLDDSADGSFNLTTSVPAGTETDDASTNSRTVQDAVGNEAVAGPIGGNKVDKKAPSISCGSPDGVWHADDVSIACTASDGGSGVSPSSDESFSLSTSVANGTETDDASTNSKTVEDAVGNEATAGPIGGNKVDKKAPTIVCPAPAPTFLLNQSPADVDATANDAGSGPASQNVSAAANTSSVGAKTASLSATDDVGNVANQNCGYSVSYAFGGFYQPVDNPGVMNVVKAGQAIPLKWRLLDANGAPVTNLTAVRVSVTSLACAQGATTDLLEEVAAGESGLQNLGNGYYQFNWKSPTSYANSCKTLHLDLYEGLTHQALFQFRK